MRGRDPQAKGWHAWADQREGFDPDAASNGERALAHAEYAASILANLTAVERNHGHATEATGHATLALFYRDLPDVTS